MERRKMFLHERRACLEAVAETVRKSNGSENREREKKVRRVEYNEREILI